MAVLEIENLVKKYQSPDGSWTTVVDVASFFLKEGAQVALQGLSGTGKTTFLNLIAGILRPDSGKISVVGANIAALTESRRDRIRAENIGYVFQTFNLLQGYTALENVMLGMMFSGKVDFKHAKDLLERVGMKDRMNHKPRQLSVGQQQRVAVARALANRPRLVLADEPTGNLDYRNAREAVTLIRETCRESGAALLLVSHDREVLGQFENVQNLAEINRAAAVPEAAR